jgi:two-component system phosphate regulon sensor histidine kinase PhoR
MWPTIAILAGAGLVYCLVRWRRQQHEWRDTLARREKELARLQDEHQQAIAGEHAQQQALFNSMVEGVLVLDSAGKIRLVNQAMEGLFKFTSDVRGQTIMEAFRLDDLQKLVNRTLKEGQVLEAELELPGLDNRCLQVNAVRLLNREGRAQGMILVCHDLTRLKQLENTRREFVANVSHELRTPLSMIKGYVETLMDGAKDDPAVSARFLQTIDKHADRLTYLIEDLLTISKLESGQVVMNLQPVELSPVVQRVLDDLQSRASEKKVNISNQVPGELVVHADADRLQQVLFNLVDNAIKYGKTGGSVIISAKLADAKHVELGVKDDGPGIPPDAIDRIFERFYRVDKARSREQGGTGLGLAIVKHIIQSHGGEVWAESELGNGTTFYFTLPPENGRSVA